MRHWVYIHWPEVGPPLYVGRTANPVGRTITHRSNSKRALDGRHRVSRWFSAVARIEWQACLCNRSACRLEEQLIAELDPPFNTNGRSLDDYHARAARARVEAARITNLAAIDARALLRFRNFVAVLDAIEAVA